MLDMHKEIDLSKVEEFAILAHKGQFRSNGRNYHEHVISVANRLRSCGISDKVVLATAYLHDVLEDTNKTEKDILDLAGPEVLEAVKHLTNKETGAKKNEALIAHALKYNDVAKRVKLADRYDNLVDAVFDWEPKRVRKYAHAGLLLLEAMQPLPADVLDFEREARRFIACLLP